MYFVAPHSQKDSGSFARLLDLPLDVLLLVFGFCDASTRFQTMHTCTAFRYMTSRLFWADPTVWYVVYNHWWRARKSNLPDRLDVEFCGAGDAGRDRHDAEDVVCRTGSGTQ
jgi:hypothetical protein